MTGRTGRNDSDTYSTALYKNFIPIRSNRKHDRKRIGSSLSLFWLMNRPHKTRRTSPHLDFLREIDMILINPWKVLHVVEGKA